MGNEEAKHKKESEDKPTKAANNKRHKTNDAQQRAESTNEVSNKNNIKAKRSKQTGDAHRRAERTNEPPNKSEVKAKSSKVTSDAQQKPGKPDKIPNENEAKTNEQDPGRSTKAKKAEPAAKKTATKSESKNENKITESKTKAKSETEAKKSESKKDLEKKRKKKTDANAAEHKELTKSGSKKHPKSESTQENATKLEAEKAPEEKRKSKVKGEKQSERSSAKRKEMQASENTTSVQGRELTTEPVSNKRNDDNLNKIAENAVDIINEVADGNDAVQKNPILMRNDMKEKTPQKRAPPEDSLEKARPEDAPHDNIVHEDISKKLSHKEVLHEKVSHAKEPVEGAITENANENINQSNETNNQGVKRDPITVPVLSSGKNSVRQGIDVESEIYRKRNVGTAIYSRIQRLAVIKQASLNYDKNQSALIFDDEDDYTNSNPLSQTVKLLEKSNSIVGKLRLLMSSALFEKRPLDAYIIKATGSHGTKYVSEDDRKLQFASGVSSPTGIAVVASKIAVLWTDEQHYDHAKKEAYEDWTVIKCDDDIAVEASKWLVQNLASEALVGFDPKFLSYYDYDTIYEKLLAKDINLEPITTNLVDVIWNKPKDETVDVKPLVFIDDKFSGYSVKGNIESIRDFMQYNEIGLYIMTNLDDIAWTFKLRGFDYPYGSVFMSYAMITPNSVELYVDAAKLTEDIKSILTDNDVHLKEYKNAVEGIKHNVTNSKNKVLLTVDCSYDIARLVPKPKLVMKSVSPVQSIAATRSYHDVEILRKAFIEQAMAVCEFLYWLENTSDITELSAVQKMQEITSMQDNFLAFDCPVIVAFGQHTSDPSFIPSDKDNYAINPSALLVIRTGSCYKGGQTSMARTVHVGEPSPDQKESFTKLLKVFIAFALTKFPSGITQAELTTIENQNLWRFEIESKRDLRSCKKYWESVDDNLALFTGEICKEKVWAGTTVSNNPNYFKSNDDYSIQLENILVCKEIGSKKAGSEKFLAFEDLTLIPLQRKLIDKLLLSETELDYVNAYHRRVRDLVGAELRRVGKQRVFSWLTKETESI